MNIKTLLFLIISNFALSQSFEVSYPNTDNIYLVDNQEKDKDYKMKFKFNNYENKFWVMNQLLYDNKNAKSLLYIKFLNIYVVSNGNHVDFYGFNELFPKKGFHKTGVTKNFFGEKSDEYKLDNDILQIKLWIAEGKQVENEMYNYLKSLNLLRNIPTNKKLRAVSLQNIEFDNDTSEKKNKNFTKSSLEYFVWSSGNSEYNKCINHFQKNRKLSLDSLSIPKEKIFTYEVLEKHSSKKSNGENSALSDDTGNAFIRIKNDKETNESKAYYYDYSKNSVLIGSLKDGIFLYSDAYKIDDDCKGNAYKKIEENDDCILILKYPTTGNYELAVYEIQKKNSPKFFYNNLQVTGFLKSIRTLNSNLEEFNFDTDFKKSNTKVIFVKK